MSARVRVSSGFWGQLNLLWSFIGSHIAITQVDMHTQRVGGWVMDTFSYTMEALLSLFLTVGNCLYHLIISLVFKILTN